MEDVIPIVDLGNLGKSNEFVSNLRSLNSFYSNLISHVKDCRLRISIPSTNRLSIPFRKNSIRLSLVSVLLTSKTTASISNW